MAGMQLGQVSAFAPVASAQGQAQWLGAGAGTVGGATWGGISGLIDAAFAEEDQGFVDTAKRGARSGAIGGAFGGAGKAYGAVRALGTAATGSSTLVFDATTQSWRSQSGLIFGQGSKQGNRLLHVLEHLRPVSGKSVHTLFDCERNQLVALLDEAWALRGTPLANDAGAYVINMGRAVGQGGETAIKIIVKPGTFEIRTAYPVFP